MKNEDVTAEVFDTLLKWLDSNQQEAALKYERIRLRLITFFVCGGCGGDSERLADEAFNRVSQKLNAGQVSESHFKEKIFYFLGFAKNIRHEYYREQHRHRHENATRIIDLDNTQTDSNTEEELECLDQCIGQLPTEKRSMVIEYYLFEGSAKIEHRKKIASQLGIDTKALRLRVHRLREQLKPCIENCLAASQAAS